MSVRIWNTGGYRIKDATATPDDVMQGKVFYNNDGRQVGISNSIRLKSILIQGMENAKRISSLTGRYGDWTTANEKGSEGGLFQCSVDYISYGSYGYGYSATRNLTIGTILGIKIKGQYIPVGMTTEQILQGGVYPGTYVDDNTVVNEFDFANFNYDVGDSIYGIFTIDKNKPNMILLPEGTYPSFEIIYTDEIIGNLV